MAPFVTEQDKSHASRLLIAIKTRNRDVVAEELAFIREDAIRCAEIRILALIRTDMSSGCK